MQSNLILAVHKVENPQGNFGARYVLTIRKHSKLEWLILRLTRWPVEHARLGTDIDSFVTVYVCGKHRRYP